MRSAVRVALLIVAAAGLAHPQVVASGSVVPGRYIVVGTRLGYRDVRRELVVEAGREPPLLVVRCEEEI